MKKFTVNVAFAVALAAIGMEGAGEKSFDAGQEIDEATFNSLPDELKGNVVVSENDVEEPNEEVAQAPSEEVVEEVTA